MIGRLLRRATLPGLGVALLLLSPGLFLAWARLDVIHGRGALDPAAEVLWSLVVLPPRWDAYRSVTPWPGAVLVLLGGGLLVRAAWRGRRGEPREARPGAWLLVLGAAVLAIRWSLWWLWLLPAAGASLIPRAARSEEASGNRRTVWLVVLAMVAVGSVLRFAHIDRFPHGVSGHYAGHLSHTHRMLGDALRGTGHYGHIPHRSLRLLDFLFTETDTCSVQHLINALVMTTLGWSHHAQRMAAAWIGLLTIPPVYLLGRRLYGRRAGLAAAGLLTVSCWHNAWCRYEGSIQIQNPLHQAVGLLLLIGLLEVPRFLWPRAAALGIWLGASCLLHASSHTFPLVLLAVPAVAALSPSPARRRLLLGGGIALILAAAVYLVRLAYLDWSLVMFLNTRLGGGPRMGPELVATNLRGVLLQLFHEGRGMHLHYVPLHPLLDPALLALVPLGLGVALRRFRDRSNLLILAALLAALLPGTLAPEPAPRRLITLLIPACLLGGLAWDRLTASLGRRVRWIGVPALAAMGVLHMGLFFGTYHALESEISYDSTLVAQEAGRLLETHAVIVPTDVGINSEHLQVMNHEGLKRVGSERLILVPRSHVPALLEDPASLPAPPVLVLPDRPELEGWATGLGGRPRRARRRWRTPRAPWYSLLVVELPTAGSGSA